MNAGELRQTMNITPSSGGYRALDVDRAQHAWDYASWTALRGMLWGMSRLSAELEMKLSSLSAYDWCDKIAEIVSNGAAGSMATVRDYMREHWQAQTKAVGGNEESALADFIQLRVSNGILDLYNLSSVANHPVIARARLDEIARHSTVLERSKRSISALSTIERANVLYDGKRADVGLYPEYEKALKLVDDTYNSSMRKIDAPVQTKSWRKHATINGVDIYLDDIFDRESDAINEAWSKALEQGRKIENDLKDDPVKAKRTAAAIVQPAYDRYIAAVDKANRDVAERWDERKRALAEAEQRGWTRAPIQKSRHANSLQIALDEVTALELEARKAVDDTTPKTAHVTIAQYGINQDVPLVWNGNEADAEIKINDETGRIRLAFRKWADGRVTLADASVTDFKDLFGRYIGNLVQVAFKELSAHKAASIEELMKVDQAKVDQYRKILNDTIKKHDMVAAARIEALQKVSDLDREYNANPNRSDPQVTRDYKKAKIRLEQIAHDIWLNAMHLGNEVYSWRRGVQDIEERFANQSGQG